MKTKILGTIILLMIKLATTSLLAFDPPPPPPNGGNGDKPPSGGGAPIEGGMAIFVGLAAGYGLWKKHNSKKEGIMKNEEA